MANRISDFLRQTAKLRDALPGSGGDRLQDLVDFGANPGALNARIHVPANLSRPAPLVVVLHGCTQDAAGYDRGSGWSRVADIGGFALLFPEQRRENNPNLCFNWFVPGDIRRDGGEAASIRQMVAAVIERHPIDAGRVFVTGLSAGGAMAAVMLAAYPDVFAGGSVIAGLPYGCAANVPQALKRMRGEGMPDAEPLADRLRQASGHRGRWPTLTVWHGTADATVSPANAELTLAQWRAVHDIPDAPSRLETGAGFARHVWRTADGRDALQFYAVGGMGHGTPLKTSGPDSCGVAGPFMLDVGVSSTCRDARAWGLLDAGASVQVAAQDAAASRTFRPGGARPTPWRIRPEDLVRPGASAPPATDVGGVIGNALRKAGLMQ
jgi:poly(hydroxyalkanoate) depolymerase family esterase